MNSAARSWFLFALMLAACAPDHRRAAVSGAWIGHTEDTSCAQCENWFTLDLSETSAGKVRGVFGAYTVGEIDMSTTGAYVAGSRVGDSISLIATMPCDSSWGGTTLGFHGGVSARGDSVRAELSFRFSTHSERIPLILTRGPIDSVILADMKRLKAECPAAA
jgi:hypothetical protein